MFSETQTSLDELAQRFGTDKGGAENLLNPDRPPHDYATIYTLLFEARRFEVSRVLECGIGSSNSRIIGFMGESAQEGASLRVWRDYFPRAEIVGLDIDLECLFEEDRITTFQVDQLEPESIKRFDKALSPDTLFDVVIDDGLHTFSAATTLLSSLWHRVAPGGVWVIEDVHINNLLKTKAWLDSSGFEHYGIISLSRGSQVRSDNNLVVVFNRT